MSITLLPPSMMRLAGIKVDEFPKFLSETSSANYHLNYSGELEQRLPLKLDGLISYISCRMPSKYEINNPNLTL